MRERLEFIVCKSVTENRGCSQRTQDIGPDNRLLHRRTDGLAPSYANNLRER